MKYLISVKLKAKTERVEETESGFIVHINAPPEKGKANEAIIRLLARYFNVPRSRIRIIRGRTSRMKLVEIT